MFFWSLQFVINFCIENVKHIFFWNIFFLNMDFFFLNRGNTKEKNQLLLGFTFAVYLAMANKFIFLVSFRTAAGSSSSGLRRARPARATVSKMTNPILYHNISRPSRVGTRDVWYSTAAHTTKHISNMITTVWCLF